MIKCGREGTLNRKRQSQEEQSVLAVLAVGEIFRLKMKIVGESVPLLNSALLSTDIDLISVQALSSLSSVQVGDKVSISFRRAFGVASCE